MMTMTMAAVRSRFRHVLDSVENTHERVVITRHGRQSAVIMSVEDLESLEETLEIMSDPELIAAIQAGEEDAAAGRTVSMDEVRRRLHP